MPISVMNEYERHLFWPPHQSGRLNDSSIAAGALTTVTHTADTLFATPIFIPATITYTTLGIEVTTASSGSVRLGIYTDNGGVPNTLVVDGGATFTSTPAQFRSVTISQVLSPGWYWLASLTSVSPTVRALTQSSGLHLMGFSSGTDTTVHGGWSVSKAYGALPSTFTGGGALLTTNPPRHMIGY